MSDRRADGRGAGVQGPGGARRKALAARGLLAADGLACAAAGIALGGGDGLLRAVDPSLRLRLQLVLALGATSASLLSAAARTEPRPDDLLRSAAVNGVWTGVCLAALVRGLSRRGSVRTERTRTGSAGAAPSPFGPSGIGLGLIAATAVFDAAAGLAQWRLGSRMGGEAPRRSSRPCGTVPSAQDM
ncbi:hypothetical protein [Brevibacterium album]|uniref:hypothetical protein n=1 Tax=Brevibacterium album TaxID=417948 RepID=UPI0003FDE9EC|nr:hypothetical protein [Brevibacterium album]